MIWHVAPLSTSHLRRGSPTPIDWNFSNKLISSTRWDSLSATGCSFLEVPDSHSFTHMVICSWICLTDPPALGSAYWADWSRHPLMSPLALEEGLWCMRREVPDVALWMSDAPCKPSFARWKTLVERTFESWIGLQHRGTRDFAVATEWKNNIQSPAPWADALSIGPQDLLARVACIHPIYNPALWELSPGPLAESCH